MTYIAISANGYGKSKNACEAIALAVANASQPVTTVTIYSNLPDDAQVNLVDGSIIYTGESRPTPKHEVTGRALNNAVMEYVYGKLSDAEDALCMLKDKSEALNDYSDQLTELTHDGGEFCIAYDIAAGDEWVCLECGAHNTNVSDCNFCADGNRENNGVILNNEESQSKRNYLCRNDTAPCKQRRESTDNTCSHYY